MNQARSLCEGGSFRLENYWYISALAIRRGLVDEQLSIVKEFAPPLRRLVFEYMDAVILTQVDGVLRVLKPTMNGLDPLCVGQPRMGYQYETAEFAEGDP
jgi:hypothetical protein